MLAADPDIDAVLGTGPNVAVRAVAAGTTAGVDLFIGGFDISTDIIGAIEAGDIDFTVDQQQYVQGYLPSFCCTCTTPTSTPLVVVSRF